MPDKEFGHDDIDRIYDEAMKWQPPQAGPQPFDKAVVGGKVAANLKRLTEQQP